MAFFNTNFNAEANKDFGESKFITEGGVYDVTIKHAIVSGSNSSNATAIDFIVDYKGGENSLYGLWITNKDGNRFYKDKDGRDRELPGSAIFNGLLVVSDIKELSDPVNRAIKNSWSGKVEDKPVLADLDGLEVKVGVRVKYSRYNGEIKRTRDIVKFYRSDDGATAGEITANSNKIGNQMSKDMEYFKKPIIQDGITEQEIAEYEAMKKGGNKPTTQTDNNPFNQSETIPF